MAASYFLLLLLLSQLSGTAQQCSSVINLKETNITAKMERAEVFNSNFSNPEFVSMFRQDKAFCVIPHSGFFIQIDFKKIVTISAIKTQGFILNHESLFMAAFYLEFSIDGRHWFEYHYKSGAKFLVAKFSDDNGDEIMSNYLDKPVATRFMRLMPQQPTKQSLSPSADKICLRMELHGCLHVLPPEVTTPAKIYASIPGNSTISCKGAGTFGLSLGWSQNSTILVKNHDITTNVEGTISNLIESKLSDLDKLKCQAHTNYLNCSKLYTCYGSYFFQKDVFSVSSMNVVFEVYFPTSPKLFKVKTKVKDSVTLSWEPPDFKDLTEEMVEYVFKCNHSNSTPEILPINMREKTIVGLGIYKQYRCTLKVQLKSSFHQVFPFKFSQKPVVMDFLSSTVRPNIKPSIKLQVQSPTQIDVTLAPIIFDKFEYGKVSGFIVKAQILLYGPKDSRRDPETYFDMAKEIKLDKEDRVVDANPRQYTINNIIPWSKYRVTLTVFNNDNLESNSTIAEIEMPEGEPSRGIELVTFISRKNMIGVETKIPFYFRNGEIVTYQLNINPGNIIKLATPTNENEIFEIDSLTPNTKYTLRCKAATTVGFGPFGPPLEVWTSEDIPSAPLKVQTLQAGNSNHVRDWYVSWEKPDVPNGNITDYSVRMELKNGTIVKYMTSQRKPLHYHVKDIPKAMVKKINVKAYTKAGWGPFSDPYFPVDGEESKASKNLNRVILIIVIIVAVIFLVIVVCLVVIFKRRHTRPHKKDASTTLIVKESTSSAQVEDEEEFDEIDLVDTWLRKRTDSVGTGSHSIANNTRDPIAVDKFAQYVESVKVDEYGTLRDEFTNIPNGKCSPWQCAELPENRVKNRYTNINAYDHSRVVLKEADHETKASDYINANYIQGFNYSEDTGSYRYISAQGPLDNTRNDFWLMIWQQEVSVIVMVTNLLENDRVKCSQYWPNESDEYGDLVVTLDKIDKTADYVNRYFNIENKTTKEVRTVLQFHFVSWPDHGVPDYPTAILSLRRRIRHYYDPTKPMVVHCSAGVGRSGCFILIDAMLERIDRDSTVDVYNYLCYMRTRRVNMVQTFEQYRFAHTAILEYITFGNTEIFISELDKRIRQLGKNNGMSEEFELLKNNTTPVPSTGNPYQVLLREGKFIDAYHVDGYKQRDAFIITKAATQNNVGDFWKMVLEKQCHSIVMLNKCQEPTQEFFKYWPDVENHCIYKDITVLTMSEVANGNIITRKIKVTTSRRKCEVYHFQYVDWPEADIPHRRGYSNICTLMQAVEKSQQNLGNGPIIVHGGNGYGRSGTFIAIYNSTERLKVEQLIDVLQCVRAIRIAQPSAVDNITQYQFVYNMIRTYLEGFENYCNYKDYKATRSPLNSSSTV